MGESVSLHLATTAQMPQKQALTDLPGMLSLQAPRPVVQLVFQIISTSAKPIPARHLTAYPKWLPQQVYQLSRMAELTEATQKYLDGIGSHRPGYGAPGHATTTALNEVSATLLGSYRAITENPAAISASSEGYGPDDRSAPRNISGLEYYLRNRSCVVCRRR